MVHKAEERPVEHFYQHAIRFEEMFRQWILTLNGNGPSESRLSWPRKQPPLTIDTYMRFML
jgi:hypothetical protein